MICENCGKEHDGSYATGRFCSVVCARSFSSKTNKGLKKILICPECGIQFECSVKASKNTRCPECRKKYRAEKTKRWLCKHEGRSYTPYKTWFTGSEQLGKEHPEIEKHQSSSWFQNLVPFGFNIESLYSERIISEYEKVRNLLIEEYSVKQKSCQTIWNEYNCSQFDRPKSFEALRFVLKALDIPIRTVRDAVKNAYQKGLINPVSSYPYKHDWHTTWNGKEVYLRSSYELDFAKKLDESEIDYITEAFRIKYFDTQRQEFRVAVPDFWLPDTNEIVEIKSAWTFDRQNMIDKKNAYKNAGYNFRLIVDHKEIIL